MSTYRKYIYANIYKQYLLDLLFPRNEKKTHTDQSILQTFLLCLKRNVSQTLKVAAAKTFFSIVCIIDTICFYKCFLFHVITGRRFYTNFSLPRGVVQPP